MREVECPDSQLVDKWNEILSDGESEKGTIINVHSWTGKAMLDAYVAESRMIFIIGPN